MAKPQSQPSPQPKPQQGLKHYQNDQWTLNDNLGLGRVGDQLARMILEVTPPFTIGITGKWGSGKTSILRRSYATLGGLLLQQPLAFSKARKESTDKNNLHKELHWDKPLRQDALAWSSSLYKVAKNTRCVWFSPWQYQNEDNPLIPLLLEIQNQFSTWAKLKQTGSNINRRGGLAAMALLERVTDAAATLMLGKNIKVASGTTQDVRKAWHDAEPNLLEASDGQRFHLLFEDAIDAVLAAENPDAQVQNKARLVIFIDDLDRCEESVIVRLLEVIKLYLNSNRCVFVLGLDDTAVVDALGRYWQRPEDLNREYLEKLFQTRIPVPLPRPEKVTQGILDQLTSHEIEHAEVMAKDIELLLEPNPRKVKNFVNGLCVAWAVSGAKGWVNNKEETRRFVMFHYMQQYHRAVWRLLERQPDALPFLWAVVTYAEPSAIEGIDVSGLDGEEQGLLMEMFRRAFSHVLKSKAKPDQDEEKHGSEDLDTAVKHFIQRQDRKRSDEYLCGLIKKLISADYRLDERYLYAEAESTTPPAQQE